MVTIARLECDFIRYGWSFKPLISVCFLGEPLPKLMDRSRKDGLSLSKGHHPQSRHLGTVPVCHRQVDGRSDLPDARPGPLRLPSRGLHREHCRYYRFPAPPRLTPGCPGRGRTSHHLRVATSLP